MSWVCEFSPDAEEDLRELPKSIQKRVAGAITHMERDPFRGNVKALQGAEWKGVFRRRMGDYRILFTADHASGVVHVVRILLRSKRTYR